MKFRKTMLAALAMSALMATSAMPAFAAETEAAGTTGNAYQVVPDSVDFLWTQENPTMKVTYFEQAVGSEDKYVAREAEATVKYTTDATCEDTPKLVLTVTIDEQVFVSDEYVTGKALGHDWKELETYITDHPECEANGAGHTEYICQREGCGEKKYVDISEDLEAFGHEYGEETVTYVDIDNILTDEDGNVVFDSNGVPELEDYTKDGYYKIVRSRECTNEYIDDATATLVKCTHTKDTSKESEQHILVLAKKGVNAKITDQVGIASELENKDYYEEAEYLKTENIELEDCTKAGKYEVTYYNKEMKPISHEWITVDPHHMESTVVEFKTADDKAQCAVDGLTVVNKSCYLDVTYYEVTHCSAAGCPNKACETAMQTVNTGIDHTHFVRSVEKVAAPSGKHLINTVVKNEIEAGVDEYGFVESYDFLKNYADNKDSHITLSADTATCTETGEATVTFNCKVCDHAVTTLTVKTPALGHADLPPVGENTVLPTCTADGEYDAVVYCGRCNTELRRRENVIIPRLAHTNETYDKAEGTYADITDVDTDAQIKFVGDLVVDIKAALLNDKTQFETISAQVLAEYGEDFVVDAYAYTVCGVCGQHEVKVSDDVVITVDSVEKQGKHCQEGAIALTATYTKVKAEDQTGKTVTANDSFEYYSTMEAFDAQIDHTPGTPVKENVVEATATAPGSYDLVEYCKYCGVEISRTQHIVSATGDVVLPAVENLKATATGMNKVTLTWDAVEGAAGYLVLKDGVQIAYTTGATSYVDKNADSEDFEYYWVIPFCKNAEGKNVKGELSDYVWAIGRVVGKAANLVAVAGEEGVALTWDAVANANGYVVLSKTGSNTAPFNTPIEVTDAEYVDAAAEGLTFYWVYATYANEAGVVAAGAVSPFAWAIAE